MSRQVSHDVLRRMVSPPPPAPDDVPITSTRAMRLAVTRAADKTHDLPLSVTGIREEVLDLEAMLAAIDDQMMLVGMEDLGALRGLSALDAQLRSALIEAQTIGVVLSGAVDDRPPTGTDAMMAEPFLQAILTHLAETTPRTPLDGWGANLVPRGQVDSKRVAGLILPERPYRVIQMTIDLQIEGREGTLLMALPDHVSPAVDHAAPVEMDADWSTRFQAVVNTAPIRLAAELHRFKAPLYAVEAMEVGQVIPLTGCEVTSIKLRAANGRKVATARLGQSGGMRAVRIEQAAMPDMDDLEKLGTSEELGLQMLSEAGGMDDIEMPTAAEEPTPMDMGFAAEMAKDVPVEADDETARMLDEMEAAIASDEQTPAAWEEEGSATADLDWSTELSDAEGEEQA